MVNSPDSENCPIRVMLSTWAERFTQNHQVQRNLVEDTIAETLRRFPSAGDELPIDLELITIMHELALRKFRLSPAPAKGWLLSVGRRDTVEPFVETVNRATKHGQGG